MDRIDYNISEREALFANLRAAGKDIAEDVTINLDAQGVPQTCYCMVVDAPEPQPDPLAEAYTQIVDLSYENLLLKGGVSE
ncbi:MAG TPA: hypothetical protein PKB13_08955 [Clostridia bacterium]|nr:hypothetical protein [Clostridia bacterium]